MKIESAKQIVATYEKHGWNLRRVLIASRAEGEEGNVEEAFANAATANSEIDALWFARPSSNGREAWELRLVADQAYALFETFEADESEEDRESVRREMENKMREYVSR
jgi:hypothetical protein